MGTGLASSTTGAVSELTVACDLLKRGYEVFRAVSPSCSCDLAILKDNKLVRVEVRTAQRNQVTGNVLYPNPDRNRFDVLALVLLADNEIIYIPELN